MAARRVHTEQQPFNVYQEEEEDVDETQQYNLDELSDGEEEEQVPQAKAGRQEDVDDLINYKGIYFNDEPGQKFTDPETGAHFEFKDICRRINRVIQKRGESKDEGSEATLQKAKQIAL